MSRARVLVCLLAGVALAGCASRPINEPMTGTQEERNNDAKV